MIPDYLIIEEQLRREREQNEQFHQVPLHAPMPAPPHWIEEEREEKPEAPQRGAYIIDLNDYTVTRI